MSAEQQVKDEQARANRAVKNKERMSEKLETMKTLLREVRLHRDQCLHEKDEATKRQRKALQRAAAAEQKEAAAHKRVVTVEQQKLTRINVNKKPFSKETR